MIVPFSVMAAAAITPAVTTPVMTIVMVVVVMMMPVAMSITSAEFQNDGGPVFNPTAMAMAVVPTTLTIANFFDCRRPDCGLCHRQRARGLHKSSREKNGG